MKQNGGVKTVRVTVDLSQEDYELIRRLTKTLLVASKANVIRFATHLLSEYLYVTARGGQVYVTYQDGTREQFDLLEALRKEPSKNRAAHEE